MYELRSCSSRIDRTLYTTQGCSLLKSKWVTFDEGDTARYFDIPTLCLVTGLCQNRFCLRRQATGDDMPATIRIKPLWCHYGA